MTESTSDDLIQKLTRLGHEIDAGRQPTIYDGGYVEVSDATESEVMTNVAGKEAGSQSGSRSGRRARSRRTQAADHALGSPALEAAYGTELRVLAQHYEALSFEDKNGLWVVVSSSPLGHHGPEVYFVIALPLEQRLAPRSWAIKGAGFGAQLMSLKHTNFPDASICAFPYGEVPWPYSEGLTGLVDIYTLWAVRKLHREILGWWPGPQVGHGSLYRLKEFAPREECGCGSAKPYGICHMLADLRANTDEARTEFRRAFLCDYEDRRAPEQIIEFARSNWKKLPSMAQVFGLRKDPTGIKLPSS